MDTDRQPELPAKAWRRQGRKGRAASRGRLAAGPVLEFADGEGGAWTIGGHELAVEHREGLWSIHWPGASRVDTIVDRAPGRLHRRWALADRALIFRPEQPWRLLPRQELELFLGLPLWLRLEKDDGTPLGEQPLEPMKPTFFGRNTRSGVLGYAWRGPVTATRVRHEDPPLAGARLLVRNGGDREWLLPRIPLQVPGLTLYADPDGGLWTDDLVCDRPHVDGQLPWAQPAAQPPADGRDLRVEAEPRRAVGNHLAQVFQNLLG